MGLPVLDDMSAREGKRAFICISSSSSSSDEEGDEPVEDSDDDYSNEDNHDDSDDEPNDDEDHSDDESLCNKLMRFLKGSSLSLFHFLKLLISNRKNSNWSSQFESSDCGIERLKP